MDKTTSNIIDVTMLTIGTAFGLDQIETILGIIILVLQGVWILVKMVSKIIDHVKGKEYNKVQDDLKSGIDELKEIQKGDNDHE